MLGLDSRRTPESIAQLPVVKNPLPLLPLILDNVPRGLRQALAQEGIPLRDRRPGPPEGRFLLGDSRVNAHRVLAPGQVLIDIDEIREGWPGDPLEDLLNIQSHRVEWQISEFRATECVSRVDKREVRRRFLATLRKKIEKAGGIWLRVTPFPFPYRSAFNFRIDHDDYHAADFDATLKAIEGNEDATTHFVNGSGLEGAPEAMARLRGLDVGSHGYWHHTYRTAKENLRNILRGIEVLQGAGIEPSGFAAPHGRFNPGLLDALATLRITHSSEFSLAYDDLPFFIGSANLLQIPIHPVCLGIVLEAAAGGDDKEGRLHERAVQAVMQHWERLARSCHRNGEPVFLYGHPTGRLGRYPEVLRHALQIASAASTMWRTTFGELNAWWRARAGVNLTVRLEKQHYVITADAPAGPYRLGIEYWRGGHAAVMPLDGPVLRFSPSALAYESRTGEPVARPVRVDRPEGLRSRIRRWIDWERVTPIQEIPADSLGNLAKRTLRQLV